MLKRQSRADGFPVHFPVATRLVISFGLLGATLAAIGALFYFGLRSIGKLDRAERSSAVGEIAILQRVVQNVGLQQVEVFRHVAATAPEEKKRHEHTLAGLMESSVKGLTDYEPDADTAAEKRLLSGTLQARKAYSDQTQKLLGLSRTQRDAEAATFLLASQVPSYDRYQKAVASLLRFEEADARAIAASTTERIEQTQITGDLLIGLGVIITLGTSVAVWKIVRRLRQDKKRLQTEVVEHKQAEQSLRESEERYRLLVDRSPDAVFVVCDHKIVFVNPATLRMLGAAQPSQLLGRVVYEILPPEEHAEVDRRAAELVAGNQPPAAERRLLRLDGSTVEVESTVISFLYEGKSALQVIARDNTERKIAAEKLKAQEKQFRLLFDDNPSPMWVFDIQTLDILAVNQAAVSSYGYSREEFLGLTLKDIRPAEDVEMLVSAVSDETASSSYGGEWRHRKKDGTIITTAIYSSPTLFENRAARVTLAIDRTERAESERKMRESEANLALAQKVAGVGSWEYQFTPEGQIDEKKLTWSEEAYRLFGLPSEIPITTEVFFRAVHLDDRALFAGRFTAFMEDNEAPFKTDFRIVRPDGTERTVHAAAEKIFEPDSGKLFKVVGTVLDITERRAFEQELREAHEKYRSIFENASEGIFQNTAEGVLLSANPALARMLGFASPEELIRERNDIERQSYADPVKREEFKRLLEEKGVVENFEYQVKRKDGRTIWISENSRIVRDDSGEALYYEGSAQDITERKDASTALIESRQRLDLARKAANIGIWDWNVLTNELVWDAQMYELYGIREDDFSGAYSAWQNGLHPDDRARAETEIMAAVKGAGGFHTEFRVLWPNGTVRNVEAHAVVEHAQDGSTTRMIGVNWDITERKRIEAEVQRQKSELRVLFDLMPAMIWFKDAANGILRVNKRVADSIGKTVAEIEGKSSFEIYPEEAARFYADDLKVIRLGLPELGIIETVRTSDGKDAWFQTDKVPVFDPLGKVIGIVVMAQDITERRKADAALEDANRRLLEASRLAGMAEVATSVLHNVGNVLNSVNVSCSVIAEKVRGSRISGVARTAEVLHANSHDLALFFARDPIGQKLPDFLGKLALRLTTEQGEILRELQLLAQNIEHINDIVAVQQSHAKNLGGFRETLPIKGVVEDALRMTAGGLLRHGIEVVREYGEAPAFSLEKQKVIQILVNLFRNAKHALTDGGRDDKRMVVRIARHNGNVAVSVSDNGIGIAPENRIRIFSHGFTTKKDGHGFGLHSGVLAAQEMGGSLVAQSDGRGKGATFTLELPISGQGKN